MHTKAKFANARTVAVIRRLLDQLGRSRALRGRIDDTLVISGRKSAGIIDDWGTLLDFRMHAAGLQVSYAIFAGIEQYGDHVLIQLGGLIGLLDDKDIHCASDLRALLLGVPDLEARKTA